MAIIYAKLEVTLYAGIHISLGETRHDVYRRLFLALQREFEPAIASDLEIEWIESAGRES